MNLYGCAGRMFQVTSINTGFVSARAKDQNEHDAYEISISSVMMCHKISQPIRDLQRR